MGRALLAAVLASLTLCASALASDFEHPASGDTSQQFAPGSGQRRDTPNDPDYDQAEPDGHPRTSSNLYDERFDLFGFPSQLTPSARYAGGPNAGRPMIAGFNAAGAWKLTRGRADVGIAILDTGIRWDNATLRDQIRLNRRELPLPEGANGRVDRRAPQGGYDRNRNGAVDVDDYAADPRVLRVKPAGHPRITAQDLIHAFSDGVDADRNGYVDDIAGWDFFNDDNDPSDDSSYFAAANHGTGRAQNAGEQGDDAQGSIGVCPHCQILPVRIWDSFVSDANTFALGVVYASDNGVAVVEGANGSIYHSRFAEAASDYAYRRGVVQTYSGDDLNTADHNFPANYRHTMLIQGTVPDTIGLGSNANELGFAGLPVPLATNAPPQTFFRNANTTQYGGHSSLSMEGTTGSENTGKAAGAAGLVVSAARDRRMRLAPDETREVLEQTAEDVLPANTLGTGVPDPAQRGWDPHFGWGRANLGAAVDVAGRRGLPAQAAIDSPDWFAPLTGARVRLVGRAAARSGRFHFKVEWGPGLGPTSWTTITEGDSTRPVTDLGTLDLAAVRRALAAYRRPLDPGGPTFSPTSRDPFQGQFEVRLTVTQAGVATPGVDRRVLTALDDPTLRPGAPRRLGTGGEAPIRYADLDGDGVQELVVPLEDGTLHAYEPGGGELRGWPVRTRPQAQAAGHLSAPGLRALAPPLEPLRAPAIADLDGDGRLEVVSAAGQHVYVWEADGRPRPGFPVALNRAFCRAADQRQPLVHRKCGFLASPALGRLQGGPGSARAAGAPAGSRPRGAGRVPAGSRARGAGLGASSAAGPRPATGPLDIVVAGLDGHLYAWDPRGRALRGFPVDLVDPGVPGAKRMRAESVNDAAVGDLDGDGHDDVVVASNETYAARPQPGDVAGGFAQGVADLLAGAAGGSSRVYAISGATGRLLPGWPIALDGAIQNVLPLIGPGHDAALVKLGGRQVVVVSTTGGALAEYGVDGRLIRAAQQGTFGPASNVTDRSGPQLNLFEYATIGDVAGIGRPALVKYAVTLGQLANLALSGQNFPYNHTIGAFDAGTGAPLPAYPTITDDYQLLSASNIAKVDPTSRANQVLAGTGLGLLHAYDGRTGQDAPGFPKVTGGWLFAPAALSDDGRLADLTREGYLFEWRTRAPACQGAYPGDPSASGLQGWPSFRHDQQGTGNADADGTPPAAPGRLTLRGGRLRFVAPGDDDRCGTAAAYVARVDGRLVDLRLGAPARAGSAVSRRVRLPAGARTLALAARDEAGNVGPAAVVSVGGGGAGGGGGGGGGWPLFPSSPPPPPGGGPGGRRIGPRFTG